MRRKLSVLVAGYAVLLGAWRAVFAAMKEVSHG